MRGVPYAKPVEVAEACRPFGQKLVMLGSATIQLVVRERETESVIFRRFGTEGCRCCVISETQHADLVFSESVIEIIALSKRLSRSSCAS